MGSIHPQRSTLAAVKVTTRRLCRLHQMRLFSPALCRMKRGGKMIVQGKNRVPATPQQLTVLSVDVELGMINQSENGLFCSDLLSLTPELLTAFKTHYPSEPPPGRLISLCAPVMTELAFTWQGALQVVQEGLSTSLQLHQTMSLLLALHEAGYADPLLVERQQDLSVQVRQLVMLSPAQTWSVSRVMKISFLDKSTLRRRLQQESQGFRQIVKEVQMAHALGQLQTASRPISKITQNSGYQLGSRFTARLRQHYGLLPKRVR